jgi:hypothetical protein
MMMPPVECPTTIGFASSAPMIAAWWSTTSSSP